MNLDARLADEAIRNWLGDGTTRIPLTAMNSSWSRRGTLRQALAVTGRALITIPGSWYCSGSPAASSAV